MRFNRIRAPDFGIFFGITDFRQRSKNILPKMFQRNISGNLTVIALYEISTGLDDVQGDKVQCTKVLRDGVLYLMYDGVMYDVQGKKVR